MSSMDANVKKMADLLKEGASMLSYTCPDCKTPLFKLSSGEVFCPSCNKRAVFAKATEVEKVAVESVTSLQLEDVILQKVSALKNAMACAKKPDEIESTARTIMVLYDLLERVRKTKA